MHTYTLFDLHNHIRRVMALNYPEALWITAEIAQVSHSRGHVFVDLVQKDAGPDGEIVAQASAVIWQRDYQALRLHLGLALHEVLQDGREVRMQVRVDFHERYGFKLQVADLDPAYTFGQVELRRRQTIQTLQQLGLLDRNRALPLPPVLQRIAVISSEGAAGFQDFQVHLAANPFGFRFHCRFFFSAVQGKSLETEMLAALEAVSAQREQFDCAVVLRGGGARLDLEGFDRLELCKTAAALPVPLFTGIGHDTDETVLDLVAHRALKTPTAVADFLIQHNLFFEHAMLQLAARAQERAGDQLNRKTLELGSLESALRWGAAARNRAARQQLETLASALPALLRQHFRRAALQLGQAEALCAAFHPDAVLRRGFSMTLKKGKVVTAASEVTPGDVLETRLREGAIWLEVKPGAPEKPS